MFATCTKQMCAAVCIATTSAMPLWSYDLDATRVQYTVAQAHLDTQWNHTIETTINQLIPNTLRENFALMERYPDYVFSFEGAFRYMLAKEHHPTLYDSLKQYVASGQWALSGSMLELPDVNIPSPESLIRQVLYGNGFFQQEFGKRSVDIFLVDCFGFGAALPTIATHCGLEGFATCKLDGFGGSSQVPPFEFGMWEGVDGSAIAAAFRPSGYKDGWGEKRGTMDHYMTNYGVGAAYQVFGVGDGGGAPRESEVRTLVERMQRNDSETYTIISASSDQIFRDLTDAQKSRLPRYKGELLMKYHGVGCYTAKGDMKRYNRQCEMLADAAERASVAAELYAQLPYPAQEMTDTWIQFLWHQMHDDLTGVSVPAAYTFSRGDYEQALSGFAGIRNSALTALSEKLDTRGEGVPVVVFNPLCHERSDVVEAQITMDPLPAHVRAFDAAGNEIPCQVLSRSGTNMVVLMQGTVPGNGLAVFHVRGSDAPCALQTGLSVSNATLENQQYRVTIDANGDISTIYHKETSQELLAAPIRLEARPNRSTDYPGWEIHYDAVTSSPRSVVGGPATVAIEHNGPVRVALRIERTLEGSTFVQHVSLDAGNAGQRVHVYNEVDWQTRATLLKASFKLSASNPRAVYDLGLGTIERGNNTEGLYEVVAQKWAAMTSTDGSYGTAILSDNKYGWDKPTDDNLRLTLFHTPQTGSSFSHQADLDIGKHRFSYAIVGHAGDWKQANMPARAEDFTQPLVAQQTTAHDGPLGKIFSLVQVQPASVAIMAVKKAEDGNGYIVRVRETMGNPVSNATLTFASELLSANTVSGQEDEIGAPSYRDNAVSFDLGTYQPKAFRVSLRGDIPQSPSTRNVLSLPAQPTLIVLQPQGGRALTVAFPATLGNSNAMLRVHSVNGRTLVSTAVSSRGKPVQIGRLPPASYVVSLTAGGKTISRQVFLGQ